MKNLVAFCFSGTGNTRYVTQKLCRALSQKYTSQIYDVPCNVQSEVWRKADILLLAFPVYGSSPPIPMRYFVHKNKAEFAGKEVIVVATQYMFSGDGAASLGRTVEKFGGKVRYAEHVCMPNNLSDCKVFPVRNGDELAPMLQKADARIDAFAQRILDGKPFRRGFSPIAHAVGYFSQRALYRLHENEKRSLLKVDSARCTGCGACVRCCPVGNLTVSQQKAAPMGKCTLCYRCVNLCPRQAITIVGKAPPRVQYKGVRFSAENT